MSKTERLKTIQLDPPFVQYTAELDIVTINLDEEGETVYSAVVVLRWHELPAVFATITNQNHIPIPVETRELAVRYGEDIFTALIDRITNNESFRLEAIRAAVHGLTNRPSGMFELLDSEPL